jgi:hypothetical protein
MMTEPASLDHVGLVGGALEPLLAAARRLGFAPTPPKPLLGRHPATGEPRPLGQSSAHLVFESGYVELSAVHSTSPDHHLAHGLARHEGLLILALGVEDVAAAHARCRDAGLPVTPVTGASRAIEYGDRHGETRFEWFMLAPAASPEGLVCCVRNLTPELVFQPAVQSHPNGAVALAGVYVAAEEPQPLLARMAAVTGAQPRGDRLDLRGGWLRVLTPAALEARFPGAGLPQAPCLAGFAVRVADLGRARAAAAAGGVPLNESPGGFWVAARRAGGGIVEFGG